MCAEQRRWHPTFSEHSHGLRPKRSAHQAIAKAQQYIADGNRWVVDLDLEKFFDRGFADYHDLEKQVYSRIVEAGRWPLAMRWREF